MDIAQCLEAYTKEIHPQGESLPIETQVYRVQVLIAFMRAGVPLVKIDSFVIYIYIYCIKRSVYYKKHKG